MNRRSFLLACALLAVPPVLAQEANDPVTGSWGRNGLPYLELKFDGKKTVSGTAIWRAGDGGYEDRAPIKTGTFDPETGALRLEGEAKTPDGEVRKYLIEGKVDKDTVSGTFKFGERSGEFRFSKL